MALQIFLEQSAEFVALLLEGIAILMIAIGAFTAIYRCIWPWAAVETTKTRMRRAWLGFAGWLILGLEFTLGADVVRTAITPTWDQIGQLAAIAAIRTALNFFLEHDLHTTLEET